MEKKGVNALFSRDEERRRPGFLIGNVAILVGLALWAINIAGAQRPGYFGPSGLPSYTSLVLTPLGLLFVVSGAGVSLSHRSRQTLQFGQQLTGEANKRVQIPPSSMPISITSLRLGIVAFLESFLIVTLYAGILDEYKSNASMQDWVRRTLPAAQILLSYEMLIIASGILAILVVQFLPGGHVREKVA